MVWRLVKVHRGNYSDEVFGLCDIHTQQNDWRSDFILLGLLRARQESLEAASAKLLVWNSG